MKIIHIITGLGGGGAEKMLVRLVTSGHRDRFEHVVVSLTDEGVHGAALHAGGIRLITLGMNRSVTDIRRIFRLRGLLLQEQPDLIQTWLYHSDLLGFVVGKLAGIATIGWNIRCSDMELQHYGFLTRVSRRILALLSPLVSFAIVNSAAGRDFHVNLGFRCRRWEWISNGFDLTDLRPDPDARTAVRAELGVSADTHVIGMLARFNKQKDHVTFLRAASILAGSDRSTHFLLAGLDIEWKNDALRQAIEQAGLTDRVHLLGFRSDVRRILAACDLFTLSSAFGEGFPNVIGEAMSCALPCVATDVGDSALIIGDTGRVVPPRDAVALAGAWRELLSLTAENRMALGIRARKRIEQEFELNAIVNKYEAVYAGFRRTPELLGETSHAS